MYPPPQKAERSEAQHNPKLFSSDDPAMCMKMYEKPLNIEKLWLKYHLDEIFRVSCKHI